MKSFIPDMNAREEISRLEKSIKKLERKASKQQLSEDEIKTLSDYKTQLFLLKFKNFIIKS